MGSAVAIAFLVALCVYLGIRLNSVISDKRALEENLQSTRKELERYAPIRSVEAEVLRKRKQLEEEVAAAAQEVESARRDLDSEIKRRKQEAEEEAVVLNARLASARQALAEAEARLREYELRLDLEEMGFYQPKFSFEDSLKYGEALDLIREAEKQLITQKLALDGLDEETPIPMRKLGILGVKAFNGEAHSIISAATYNNFEASKEKLRIEFTKINNLLEATELAISPNYLELKVKEMAIAYDFREAEERVKQEQAELRAMMREEEEA
ncbi:MAG: DUF4041 domain-containing protein, partial [Terriglobia bacterium]